MPKPRRRVATAPMPLPDQVALLLQGGGALGSYQAGVYEKLHAQGIEIDWVAGISIGAVNAALIAGNEPDNRVARLRSFWDSLSAALPDFWPTQESHLREAAHLTSAATVAMWGVPGFFRPYWPPQMFAPDGSAAATSYYDTTPLIETLDAHIDWDLLNDGPVRLSVGAVNVTSGNFEYFDTRLPGKRTRIDARHVMASGALPPGLPAVKIGEEYYWDGGLVSNTPLAHVLDHQSGDMLIFQVDLFPAEGPLPRQMSDVYSRAKDIQYSSRTRQVTDQYLRLHKFEKAARKVLDKLPAELANDPDVRRLREMSSDEAINIVHLIYRSREWESGARDFEFSRATMLDHWAQGAHDVDKLMHKRGLIAQNITSGRSATFDLDRPGHLKEKSI